MSTAALWIVSVPRDASQEEQLEELTPVLAKGKLGEAASLEYPEFKVSRVTATGSYGTEGLAVGEGQEGAHPRSKLGTMHGRRVALPVSLGGGGDYGGSGERLDGSGEGGAANGSEPPAAPVPS